MTKLVQFLDDFPWKPSTNQTIVYKKGMATVVTRRCADRAIKAGKAKVVPKVSKRMETPDTETTSSDAE
ncbi:MAG: hypothetical protein OEQ29_01655 [Alphaproteobacteria bacterium]|nr:hypothetical protein [Alphaproteobacteria bacterium]